MFLAACMLIGFAFSVNAQSVGINSTGAAPNSSAILDVSSTTKGFLPPRMNTTQRNSISSPVEGLVIYNTDEKALNIYNGTTWGLINPVICGQSFSDPRDGKVYTTVQIGTQCWMAQNLNIGTRIDGSVEQTNNDPTPIIEKYCYEDNEANCDVYGGLYQWNEMMQYSTTPGIQGICPTGWHLPTDAEWTTLTTYLGGESVAGGAMKETGFTHWIDPNTGATNSSGFTGLPAAHRDPDGLFYFLGYNNILWSSTEYNGSDAGTLSLDYGYNFVGRNYYIKSYGFSVRCVKSRTTAATAPGAPTIGTATAGNGEASVTFSAPGSDGGSEITLYTATSNPGGFTGTSATAGTITVTGLTNGTAYTFTVTATNAIGTGAASAASNSVTPEATVPDAPLIGTAIAGVEAASVPFTAPVSNGGSTIISYTATSTPGNFTGTLTQAGSGTIIVAGLTGGTAYTFCVTATNAVGTGAASDASNSVTPVAGVIGTSFGGGKIAYILGPDDPGYSDTQVHGLITATTDQIDWIQWATSPFWSTGVPGGTSFLIGTGLSNTDKIIAQNGAGTTYAAGVARAYNGGGYSDWFLPSRDELEKVCHNRGVIGGFANEYYYASSEYYGSTACIQHFGSGIQQTTLKYNPIHVRAIRTF